VDLLDLVIAALRLLLVAVLYGFLIVVVRVAARGLQVRPPGTDRGAQRAALATTAPVTGLRLVVVAPGGAALRVGQVVEVGDGVVLGRAERAGLVLADATVSSEHARVQRGGQGWLVADLGSTNGTRLNDTPLPQHGETPLASGDVLSLGNVKLRVAR
jgi:pSer/pThr/pTyr-binding forkhead associated (FHA) protein